MDFRVIREGQRIYTCPNGQVYRLKPNCTHLDFLWEKAITLPSLLLYFPEPAYGLIAIAALGIGWSVVYTVMFLMKRRAT